MLSYSIYHHVRLDTRFVTLFLSVIILEGVGRQLDDHMSMVEQVLPIIRAALPEYEDVWTFSGVHCLGCSTGSSSESSHS